MLRFFSRVSLPVTVPLLTLFITAGTLTYSQSGGVQDRSYVLDDFDYNTTASHNDFYGNRGVWNTANASIQATFRQTAGAHALLVLTYNITAGAASGGYWEQFSYNPSDINNPVFDLSPFDELHISIAGEGTFTSKLYLEFVQGAFEKSKRVELTGISTTDHEYVVDLKSALTGFNLTRMRQVALVLDPLHVTSRTGTLLIDNLRLIRSEPAPATDAEMLDMLGEKTFRYFTDLVHPVSGLVRDKASDRSVTSIAAVGFQLTALGIGSARGWMTRTEAAGRTKQILQTLVKAPQHDGATGASGYHGFYYHMLDIATGTRAGSSELSSIDASLFLAGVLFAREYFDSSSSTTEADIRILADSLYDRVDWAWMLDPVSRQFFMEWKPGTGMGTVKWDYYTDEASLICILAVASGKVAPDVFTRWRRVQGSYGSDSFVQSWWGSLFTYFFAHCWYHFTPTTVDHAIPPVVWWENSRKAAHANRQFCIDLAHVFQTYSDSSWGLTAGFGPGGYNGGSNKSYGALPLADPPVNHDGTVAPYGAGSSIVFFDGDPGRNESVTALRHYVRDVPKLWGLFGLKDGYNLGGAADTSDDWYSDEYVGIESGPLLLMLANYRDHLVWDYFMRNPHIANASALLFSIFNGVDDGPRNATPTALHLLRNYPNPFNPQTTIILDCSGWPGVSDLRVSVHDVLGREVAVLLEGRFQPERHDLSFDGSGLPSGLYYCRAVGGGRQETLPMVLLR